MIVTICSGGLDSVTLAHSLAPSEQILVSFDYGQRHRKELSYAAKAAQRLGAEWVCVDLSGLAKHLGGSALTDDSIDVPEGHYAEESMRSTVVPNRNAIMLSVAAGIAVSRGALAVALGVHAGDHFIYPDCRREFIDDMEATIRSGNDGFIYSGFRIIAPFLTWTKSEIAFQAKDLDFPIEETWSCYKGGDIHCGACGTCFERREALRLAGVFDPTRYEATPEFAAP